MSFDTLGLSAEIIRAITEKGYSKTTPIQRQAIPAILKGQDVMAGAQTGTGKTAAFTLPLLHLLNKQSQNVSIPKENRFSGFGTNRPEQCGIPARRQGASNGSVLPVHDRCARRSQQRWKPQCDGYKRSIRALILTPTRELAAQVHESVCDYGKHLHLKSTVVFGGVNITPQIKKLRKGIDILVATPGRLLDHVMQKTLNLSKVEFLVIDEADRMLDMGFIPDIRRIVSLLPKQRQNLLFFATFSNEIKELAHSLLKSPALIEVARRNTAAKNVTQIIHPVDRNRKRELLSFLIGSNNWKQVLVFTRTKYGANRLSNQLKLDGLSAIDIHGDKSQAARTQALKDFKKGVVRVLVATNVAARGLDIDQLPHVVNFDLPEEPEDYVHRIGRTGRAGEEGEALSLVCADELKLLKEIEQLLKITIPQAIIPGYEPDPSIKPVSNKKPSNKKKFGFALQKQRKYRGKNRGQIKKY